MAYVKKTRFFASANIVKPGETTFILFSFIYLFFMRLLHKRLKDSSLLSLKLCNLYNYALIITKNFVLPLFYFWLRRCVDAESLVFYLTLIHFRGPNHLIYYKKKLTFSLPRIKKEDQEPADGFKGVPTQNKALKNYWLRNISK